jgi:NADH-quinone oxidoreductase subunit M
VGYLSTMIVAPFVAAALIMFVPSNRPWLTRLIALGASVVSFTISLIVLAGYSWQVGGFQFRETYPWLPQFGVQILLGVDGISVPMVFLNAIVLLTGTIVTFKIADRPKEFYALFLVSVAGVFGVFCAVDLFVLFLTYDIAGLPMYILIVAWGSTRREYAAMKLAMMHVTGSLFIWVGMLAIYVQGGATSFDLEYLAAQAQVLFPPAFQQLFFPVIFVGFGFLAAMWPLHTWSPDGHGAAPTAVSMVAAGVLMKLGAYGIIRVAVWLLPIGAQFWSPFFVTLGTVGAVYGGVMALAQRDFKFVIANSSVSHMGYVIVGIATLSLAGMNGAVLQMFSHGVMTALFFAMVGALYDQTHTREVGMFSGLARTMPWFSGFFIIAALASLGLPGLSGFVAELLIFIGAFQTYPIVGVLCIATVALAATYMLRMVARAFFGPLDPRWVHLRDLLPGEWIAGILLIATLVIVGVYPSPFLDMINASAAPVIERVGGVR